jgi:protein-L-isoaspartate(D-aspartate) O-methyltransferase
MRSGRNQIRYSPAVLDTGAARTPLATAMSGSKFGSSSPSDMVDTTAARGLASSHAPISLICCEPGTSPTVRRSSKTSAAPLAASSCNNDKERHLPIAFARNGFHHPLLEPAHEQLRLSLNETFHGGDAGGNSESGFAEVPREDFHGPGPWPIFRLRRSYVLTPADDPVYLYADEVVGIVPDRHINNCQPSLHTYLLARAAPREGDHIVHVGAGVGYYTAIMAHVVGPSGRVTAIEFERDLVARAKTNLADYTNVSVIHGDGSTAPFEPADVIYVNAGATRPADAWLSQLNNSGRLILPLTTDKGFTASDWGNMHPRDAVFLVMRQGAEFHTQWISSVAIYPCQGMRDKASENALAAAFERGGWKLITRVAGCAHPAGAWPMNEAWITRNFRIQSTCALAVVSFSYIMPPSYASLVVRIFR